MCLKYKKKECTFHTSQKQTVKTSHLFSMQNWFALCVDSSNNDWTNFSSSGLRWFSCNILFSCSSRSNFSLQRKFGLTVLITKPTRSTYLLTPWSRVLLEKLAILQLVKKFPAFCGTRRFLTALTSARHLSLSWAGPIQSTYPNPTSWRSILILSSHLRLGLPSGLFPSGFPTKSEYIQ